MVNRTSTPPGELARGVGPAHAGVEQRLCLLAGAVPADDLVTGVEQPLGDAGAHGAEPGEADPFDRSQHGGGG
jgi:hypothetical protein